jgi:DNA-directed RNA polymerase subunit RPC12/RpoP
MIREEAITVLKAFMENPLFSEVHKAAFNIAIHDIKAYQDWNINNLILVNKDNYEPIEQEPTTKNNLRVDKARSDSELIARGDVLNTIKETAQYHTGDSFNADRLIRYIKELPSVTPQEPKTGHWMGDSYGYICSNCEHSLNDLAQSMDYISFSKPKYCPNCGARMIEPQESEEE